MRVALLVLVCLFVGVCAWEDGHGMRIHKDFRVGTQSPSNDAITLVLQADLERMEAVKRHAQEWDGPISLAVLTNAEGDVDKVKTKLDSFEDPAKRHVTVHIALSNEDANALYPINKMRNIALENVHTDWTYVMDIDESTVSNMAAHKSALDEVKSGVDASSTLFVVPSFEWAGKDHGAVPKVKSELKQLFNNQIVIKHAHFIKAYLGKFDVGRWMDSDKGINIKYADKYEPYFIAQAGKRVRFADEFVGFGNNKAQLHFELATSGMKFLALPNVFNFADECYLDYKWQYEKRDKEQSAGISSQFWGRIGEKHGCNNCEPAHCVENCPWLIDGGKGKAALVQASTPANPNLASADTEKGTLIPLDPQPDNLANLAAVDIEKGAVPPLEPQSDTQLAAPVENTKVNSAPAHSLAIPAKATRGDTRAPPSFDVATVQGALAPSM